MKYGFSYVNNTHILDFVFGTIESVTPDDKSDIVDAFFSEFFIAYSNINSQSSDDKPYEVINFKPKTMGDAIWGILRKDIVDSYEEALNGFFTEIFA